MQSYLFPQATVREVSFSRLNLTVNINSSSSESYLGAEVKGSIERAD